MSDVIAQKLRKARRATVEVDGHVFTIRRPTDAEADRINLQRPSSVQICREFVCGWGETVTERTLGVPSGSSDPVPFHESLWREWVDDRPDFWAPIYDAIVEAYNAHHTSLVAAGKLSASPLSPDNSETPPE